MEDFSNSLSTKLVGMLTVHLAGSELAHTVLLRSRTAFLDLEKRNILRPDYVISGGDLINIVIARDHDSIILVSAYPELPG
jgi:hypothetical protein